MSNYKRLKDASARDVEPTLKFENECDLETTPTYFQIKINILEARKLAWSHQSANSFVMIILGKKKHRTTVRRNMNEPFFREHFTFELYQSIKEIKKTRLCLAVMEARCCAASRLIGEANIELGSVWSQPLHQVYHKWIQLGLTDDPAAGVTGVLKVDISVLYRQETPVMPSIGKYCNEDNYLLTSDSEHQKANYIINIYGASLCGDGRCGKPPSTFVRLSFQGLVAKTAIHPRSNHPNYCEQISITDIFPSVCDNMVLEICSVEGYFNKILASAELKLSEVSHDGENGFLPTFGPSVLHTYATTAIGSSNGSDPNGPYHKGALLISLKTIVPCCHDRLRTVTVVPISSVSLDSLWMVENFYLLCPIFEVSMLDCNISGKSCGIAITLGEIPSNDVNDQEFLTTKNEIKTRKLHYTGLLQVQNIKPGYGYLNLSDPYPVLQLATNLPDYRFRMYRNNMINRIITHLELSAFDVERRLIAHEYNTLADLAGDLNKAVEDTAHDILKVLEILKSCAIKLDDIAKSSCTELDEKQLKLQICTMENIYQRISGKNLLTYYVFEGYSIDYSIRENCPKSKKDIKTMIVEVKRIIEILKSLIFKSPNGWPDIVVWLVSGGSRVGYAKIKANDVIHSITTEQSGRNCGKIQTIYMQPLNCAKHAFPSIDCNCLAAKVELMLWMGLYREMGAFDACLPPGHTLEIKEYDIYMTSSNTLMLECCINVYRAKLNIEDDSVPIFPFVRINVINSVADTTVQKTANPVWNQILRICKMLNTTPGKLVASPPQILIEVLDGSSSDKSELIGRFQKQPAVEASECFDSTLKLQWYNLFKCGKLTGKLLMSAQVVQIPETLVKTTLYNTEEEVYYVSDLKDTVSPTDTLDIQPIPSCILPKLSKYKLDIYWWGLRDLKMSRKPCVELEIDDVIIKSDPISEKKTNCNFPNGLKSHIFEAALFETHGTINLRMYNGRSFGRTVLLATKEIKDPKKFLVGWLPKSTRDVSLRTRSAASDDFYQVTQSLYVKKTNAHVKCNDILSISSKKSIEGKKKPKWRNFLKKSTDEEEYALLPQPKITKELDTLLSGDGVDWWNRFNACQKEEVSDSKVSIDDVIKINIYNSELESQQEFYRFKDWCSTFKLHSTKTDLWQDEKSLSGYLKAGFAIYEWPPPDNDIAVAVNGVDLNKGYFSNYPTNEPKKFLVRFYVIRGIELVGRDFTGKCDPYVVISCGGKHLGDKSGCVSNTTSPTFGKIFEFNCTLPDDYLYTVSLYDASTEDALIGFTSIDVEDRIFTKHRAQVGLPAKYKLSGKNRWRNLLKPSEILEDICLRNSIPPPQYPDVNTVVLNEVQYKDNHKSGVPHVNNEIKENICLSLLHSWHTMPICGYHLVPEHVETRSLFNSEKPGVVQGKVQMWVDIFPMGANTVIPPPVDITPRKEEDYELRVIIWNVEKVYLFQENSDLYLNAWLGSADSAQYSDIQYHTSTRKISFNWRMIFRFRYKPSVKKMVWIKKCPFTEVQEYLEPIFVLQVLNIETESKSEKDTATLALNLNSMHQGFRKQSDSDLKLMQHSKKINLFTARSIRAWWPLWTTNPNTGYSRDAGSVKLELTLLPVDKAILMPVGLGREPPSSLPIPNGQSLKALKAECETSFSKHRVEIFIAVIITAILITVLLYLNIPIILYDFFVEE